MSAHTTTTEQPMPGAGGLRRRRLAVGLAAGAAGAVLVTVGVIAFTGDEGDPAGTTADPAALTLPGLHGGKNIALADYRGKPVIVNLFASWCDVCEMELPAFVKLSKELDGKIQFIGVNSMETGDKDLMPRRHKLTWPLARDIGPQGSAYHDKLAAGYGMPITAFYDGSGKLVHVQKGGLLEDDLRLTLKQVYGIR